VDILSCNRREWEALDDRDRAEVARRVGVLAITDGPRGSRVRFRGEAGGWDEVRVAALPRRTRRATRTGPGRRTPRPW
jgi:ribokinase